MQIVHQLKQNANNYVKNINYDKNTMISTKFDVKKTLSLYLNGILYWHDNLTNMKKNNPQIPFDNCVVKKTSHK